MEQARLLIEQAEALGEPPEDPLLLFSVLYGFWSRTTWHSTASSVASSRPIPGARREANGHVPLMIGHRLMGSSLMLTGDIAEAEHISIRRSRFMILPSIVCWRRDLARTQGGDLVIGHGSGLLGYPEAALATQTTPSRSARDRSCCHADVRSVFRRGTLYAARKLCGANLQIAEELCIGRRERRLVLEGVRNVNKGSVVCADRQSLGRSPNDHRPASPHCGQQEQHVWMPF